MAYTVTRYPTVFGNKKTVLLKIAADSATSNVETGLKVIEGWSFGHGSMASRNVTVAINSATSGTQTLGTLGVTGCSAGDEFYVTVFGR